MKKEERRTKKEAHQLVNERKQSESEQWTIYLSVNVGKSIIIVKQC